MEVIKISEKIIAASKSNLFRGCKVISADNFSFKHSSIKFVFLILFLKFRQIPTSLPHNQIGFIEVSYLVFCYESFK